jgi:ubiquinone/menaquinone biosynthesis C-methylase UbiE
MNARTIEAMYSTADVVEQRRAALDLLDPQVGEEVLDVGCGPGYLACEIARRVGLAFVPGRAGVTEAEGG